MKVVIGPYLTWWGPYQIADLLLGKPDKDRFSLEYNPSWRERMADKLGDWLASTWVADACQWIYDRRKRHVYVRIDNYDVWNMDSTLSHIIAPMFVKLKQIKHGYAFIVDEDVPEHLRSTVAPPVENEWDTDANAELRYEWLLDEMIWAFGTDHEEAKHKFYDHSAVNKADDLNTQLQAMRVDRESIEAYEARLQNAYRLFGKYYQTFWD